MMNGSPYELLVDITNSPKRPLAGLFAREVAQHSVKWPRPGKANTLLNLFDIWIFVRGPKNIVLDIFLLDAGRF